MYKGFRPYRVWLHKLLLIFYIVFISAMCILLFPFFFKWVEQFFTNNFEIFRKENSLDSLPDFLGGLCGILIASFLDFSIISEFQKLKAYESMVPSLEKDFDYIWFALFANADDKRALKFDEELCCSMIDKIATSNENYLVFYNLPRFFIFFEKGIIAREINRLHLYVIKLNNQLAKIYQVQDNIEIRKQEFNQAIKYVSSEGDIQIVQEPSSYKKFELDELRECIEEILTSIKKLSRVFKFDFDNSKRKDEEV